MSWHDEFASILVADRPLAELTTWGIGGRARWFFEPTSAEETARLLARLRDEGLGFRVLGGGANVLVDDGLHEMPIIHAGKLVGLDVRGTRIEVESGVSFPKLVADTARGGLEGLEVLAGIPGMVGGICSMNAGGRHGEFGDHVVEVEIATAAGELRRLSKQEVGFAYRKTALPPGVVTRVKIEVREAADPAAVRRKMAEILKQKSETQPLREMSAGCVFANPEGDKAGRLIESLGLKGLRRGGCLVSPKHANFIVNVGGGTFADVIGLMEEIERRVKLDRGIDLRREVRIWPRVAAVP